MEGSTHAGRESTAPHAYLPDGNPGPYGGGTYNGTDTNQLMSDYENVFGPAARDIKFDPQRQKRHQRWHLPDALKGPNMFLTDRVDGLITDTTNSPFTTRILPYTYLENPDAKIKWNVWSFDEGMASRAPYESGARVLTQTKRSYSGYTVRHALGIRMEHNFMRSPDGVLNFQRQLKQLVGSIQYGNDLDVHMALVQAPSYAQTVAEKYYSAKRNPTQLVRQFVDMFGIIQKTPNALDLLIEEAKMELKNWGSQEPNFLLLNGKLTMQLTMSPEKTNYLTQGIDGVKRLRNGPDLDSYRGLSVIKSRAFSMETGELPRDILRRRVRTAEYYRIPAGTGQSGDMYEFYDQAKDSWFRLSWDDLAKRAINRTEDGKSWRNPAFNAHMAGGITASDSGTSDPHILSSAEWTQRPYNARISMLPSMHSLMISDATPGDTNTLILPLRYGADEARFAQTITQGANIMQQHEYPQAHVDASAWFGGGLFCDTTYHYAENHSQAFPLCNWAALDATRLAKPRGNVSSQDEWIYGVNASKVSEIRANVTPDRLPFIAFCPNAGGFSWTNAHSTENIPTTPETCIAAAFASPRVDLSMAQVLMSRCNVSIDTTCAMYRLLVPTVDPTKEDNQIMADVNGIQDERNPWGSLLMATMAASLHPSVTVRNNAQHSLNVCVPQLSSMLRTYLCKYFQESRLNCQSAGDLFKTYVASTNFREGARHAADWMSLDYPNQDPEFETKGSTLSMHDISDERILQIFSVVMGRRFFCGAGRTLDGGNVRGGVHNNMVGLSLLARRFCYIGAAHPATGSSAKFTQKTHDLVILRPNIEHEMLGVIMGRGGADELGATFWGQTELSCFDDAEHGVWGMSYKYHERAMVMNERNMIRIWDVAFDGYNGGMDDTYLNWDDEPSLRKFREATDNLSEPYTGVSMVVMAFQVTDASGNKMAGWERNWPSPIIMYDDPRATTIAPTACDPECIHKITDPRMRVFTNAPYADTYKKYFDKMPDLSALSRLRKPAGTAAAVNETGFLSTMAFQGSMRIIPASGGAVEEIQGSGHLGPSYVGVASVREGKGHRPQGGPTLQRMI